MALNCRVSHQSNVYLSLLLSRATATAQTPLLGRRKCRARYPTGGKNASRRLARGFFIIDQPRTIRRITACARFDRCRHRPRGPTPVRAGEGALARRILTRDAVEDVVHLFDRHHPDGPPAVALLGRFFITDQPRTIRRSTILRGCRHHPRGPAPVRGEGATARLRILTRDVVEDVVHLFDRHYPDGPPAVALAGVVPDDGLVCAGRASCGWPSPAGFGGRGYVDHRRDHSHIEVKEVVVGFGRC